MSDAVRWFSRRFDDRSAGGKRRTAVQLLRSGRAACCGANATPVQSEPQAVAPVAPVEPVAPVSPSHLWLPSRRSRLWLRLDR
jgi:hypothetical protein